MSLLNKEYDHLFKLVIVGNSGVGKSSLLNRFSDDTFSETYLATIGVDFVILANFSKILKYLQKKFKTLPIENKKIKLQIWDTAGQERFRTITNAYYKGADAILMVFDVTNQASFDDISSFWHNEAESYGEKDSLLMLLGNKNDLVNLRGVSFEKAQSFAKRNEILFYETSAKTSEGVETAFYAITAKLLERKEKQIEQRRKEHREKRLSKKKEKNEGLLDLSQSTIIEEKPVPLKNADEKIQKIKETIKNSNCLC